MRLHWEDLVEAIPDAMLIVDQRGRIVFCNGHGEKLFGYAPEELNGKSVEVLVPSELRESHQIHRARYAIAPFNRAMGKSLDLVGVRKDGSELPVEISLSPLSTSHGTLVVAAVRDMTQRRYVANLMSTMATTDPVTGLANKALFQDRLEQAIHDAQVYKRMVAVALFDLDLFKRVNETFGHGGGDLVLVSVAQRLKSCLPEQATLARLGGDEYALVLRDLKDVHEAAKTTQRILAAMADPFVLEGQEFFLTASAGISVYPDDGEDGLTLLQRAESAMYRAKQERNTYQHFARDTMSAVAERLKLENDLRKAIDQGELLVHYQPQIRPQDGRIVGAEALIRWNHPQRGLVSPADFIPLAEETGLIVPITEWVLATTCEQALRWREAGLPPIRMAINLSARHFKDLRLVDSVRMLLADGRIDAQSLDLELTESLLMENLDVAVSLLEELACMGVRLSIDDFGTGYSSMSYLKQLPLHALKIDRCFIRDLSTDRRSAAIVRAIIDLAHHLDLQVVAEGVEDAEQLEQLRELRCDEVQGFHYSRPLPAAAFEELLAQDPFRLIGC
jgi:diguanylate cyclase (GGDEF)-like protein/PAS domain S-box-containing protein